MQSDPKIKVIGPYSSDILRDMVNEALPYADILQHGAECGAIQDNRPDLKGVQFYVYAASASDDQLLGKLKDTYATVERYFKKQCVDLRRIIATDDELALGIARELKRRNVEKDDHIALISVGDSLYAENLSKALESQLASGKCGEEFDCHPLHKFAYSRKDIPEAGWSRGDEPPSVADFVTNSLHKVCAELQRKNQKLKVIGIVGDNSFNKLLVLRSLRSEFPEALFFTTDFDEIFTLESSLPWTRTLIIASTFGPNLSYDLQGALPSFRGDTQTSAFVATLLATGNPWSLFDVFTSWGEEIRSDPLIFEVERSGFLYSPD